MLPVWYCQVSICADVAANESPGRLISGSARGKWACLKRLGVLVDDNLGVDHHAGLGAGLLWRRLLLLEANLRLPCESTPAQVSSSVSYYYNCSLLLLCTSL